MNSSTYYVPAECLQRVVGYSYSLSRFVRFVDIWSRPARFVADRAEEPNHGLMRSNHRTIHLIRYAPLLLDRIRYNHFRHVHIKSTTWLIDTKVYQLDSQFVTVPNSVTYHSIIRHIQLIRRNALATRDCCQTSNQVNYSKKYNSSHRYLQPL